MLARGNLRVAIALALSLCTAAVGGCASIRAEPKPIIPDADLLAVVRKGGEFEQSKVLTHYATLKTEDDRVSYRNKVAYAWIAASDASYDKFVASLETEGKGTRFGSSLTVLLLNGIAVVSGNEARRALAVGSATVVGGSSAFTHDVLQDRTIGAIVAEAEARRTRELTGIRRKLVQTNSTEYPLGDAIGEINRLNRTANLDRASTALTAAANAELAKAQAEASKVVGLSIASPEIHVMRVKFATYVKEKADAATLEKLRQRLGAEASDDPIYLKQNIVDAFNSKAAEGPSAINALTSDLKTITGEEFKP
jgi:hypothetical protein